MSTVPAPTAVSTAYEDLLRHVLEHGTPKSDRTGTGTRSVFGHQMRFDLRAGFPLVTTKRVFLRGVIDFTGPAFLVAFARAVAVILTNTKTIDTVLNSMEGIVDGLNGAGFIVLFALVSLPLAFFVGSGSAGMA